MRRLMISSVRAKVSSLSGKAVFSDSQVILFEAKMIIEFRRFK